MANRYRDLLDMLPRGKFYDAKGEVLPFVDRPHEFEFSTGKANRLFLVFFNDVASGQIKSNAQGVAVVKTIPSLPPGEYAIKIVDPVDNESRNFFITVKNIATWFAAYADVLNAMDDDIDEMDLARSLDTVTPKYIEAVYGRTLRQPRPTLFRHEDYQNLLRQLRQAYRHFGAHPYGLSQAVESMTSVSPLHVPRAWRPEWRLGHQICPNGNLRQRSRLSEAEFGPPGAVVTGSPVEELANLNRQSTVYVHPGVPSVPEIAFRQPPFAQRLTVTLTDANALTLVGLNEAGLPISEVVPDPSITPVTGTFLSVNSFSRVDSATKTGTAARLGLGESRFVRVRRVGDLNLPGAAIALTYHGQSTDGARTFSWGDGDEYEVPAARSGVTLKDVGRHAVLIGLAEVIPSGSYALNPSVDTNLMMLSCRLWLNIDGRGVICVNIGASSATAATIVSAVNNALNTDLRYGAVYNSVASVLTGTAGHNNQVVMLTAPNAYSSINNVVSRIQLLPGPQDASDLVFGVPRSTSRLAVTASGTLLKCVSTARMPAVSNTDPEPYRRRFKVRVRGHKTGIIAYMLYKTNIPMPGAYARVTTTTYTFTADDIGGHLYLTDNVNSANDGLHKIINVVSGEAIIAHAYASTGGDFVVSTGQCVMWSQGEVATVVNNDGADQLTLESDIGFAWPLGSTVEVLDDTPVEINGTDGLGELDIDIDSNFRPYHDFGDKISHVSGSTWCITSSRGNFSGLNGRTLVVTGCENAENEGSFTITAVTATTAEFTNANGIAETSNFEWAVNDLNIGTAVTDDVAPVGSLMPDGWEVLSPATTIYLGNVSAISSLSTPGRLEASRVTLISANPISFQRDVQEALAWRGLPLDVAFWVQEHTENGPEYLVEVSFDGTTFYTVVSDDTHQSSVLELSSVRGPQNPFRVGGTFFVPYDAERCILRLTRTGTGIGTMSFERLTLTSSTGTGLFLGDNTIARSQKRAKFGELLYVWSAEPLTDEEKGYLGLALDGSVTTKPGHIDYITNAHGYWNRLDISEIDTNNTISVKKNIRGVYDSIEWLGLENANNLTRMETVVGTPSRLSYARPTRITGVLFEQLTMVDGGDGPGTARADLEEDSNHDGSYPRAPNTGNGTGAKLYEVRTTDTTLFTANGLLTLIPAGTPIPVPDSLDADGVQPWEFTANDQIRVNAPYYNSSATYYMDYDVLMRVTTKPFQASASGSDPTDYLWLIDFARYARHQVKESLRTRVEQASFGADFTATLTERAALDEAASLERDNGLVRETVNFADWSFEDAKTIRISSSVFDSNSIYTISYTARVPRVQSDVGLVLEWRSSNIQNDLIDNVTQWQRVENGQIISPVLPTSGPVNIAVNTVPAWHQLRVTVSAIEDVRDLRIYGMGIRGVHLFGSNAYAPGILPPAP